jgi:hypothetical protein
MEISLPTSGVFQFSPPPAVKTVSTDPTPIPTAQTDATQAFPAVQGTGISAAATANTDQAAHDASREAALSFKDTYAVSDSAASSYKDANGTLITITRDYRTGKVTYSPEPAYVKSPKSGVSLVV